MGLLGGGGSDGMESVRVRWVEVNVRMDGRRGESLWRHCEQIEEGEPRRGNRIFILCLVLGL